MKKSDKDVFVGVYCVPVLAGGDVIRIGDKMEVTIRN